MDNTVDGEALRQAMRCVPSPVVVVTAAHETAKRGITIGSFTSVSLDPPLVGFNVAHDASMYSLIMTAPRFAVHILAEDQAHLSKHFAVPDQTSTEQFEPVPHTTDSDGTPIIDDVAAVLRCTRHDSVVAGDKTILFGLVNDIQVPRPDAGAVLYYQRSYRGVGSELASTWLSPVNRASSDTS